MTKALRFDPRLQGFVCGDCAGGVVPCCGVLAEGAGVYVGLDGCCCCRADAGDAAATHSSATARSLPIK